MNALSLVLDSPGLLLMAVIHRSLQKAAIAGSLVAIVCGVIGCFVILRRMAFLGDALSHSMLAGVTAGFLFMNVLFGADAHVPAMFFGSLLAGMITVGLIGFVSQVSRIKEDTAIGVMYTGIFAAGGVLHSAFSDRMHIDIYHFIMGSVLAIEDADLWMMGIIAVVVLSVVILFYRQFQISTFDPVMAASIGVNVAAMNYLLTACTSLVVVGAVQVVGVVLVVGLLVTPAATAYLLCDRLTRMLPLAALFGVTSVLSGLWLSVWIDVASGPAIVIMGTTQFMMALACAPRYGMIADWWRKKTMVPQQLLEDVLGCFRHAMKRAHPITEILQEVERPAEQVHRAIRDLVRRDWMLLEGTSIRLTKEGRREAKRILRAHRLWESYLAHVGMPADTLHDQAHRLEHVHDEETVDYLDDKLGHPLTDPHGSEIPEDFEHLVPGNEVKVSLLREGHRAVITSLALGFEFDRLSVGMHVLAGERQDGGRLWTLHLPGDQTVQLNHDEADAITVRLENELDKR